MAPVAAASLAVGLVALAHAAFRADLPDGGRVALLVGVIVVPFGGVDCFILGRDRTRVLAQRVSA